MNLFFIFSGIFILFIVLDILTAKLMKIKRTLPRNITFAALCLLVIITLPIGIGIAVKNSEATSKALYMAYNFILDNEPDKAEENAEKVGSGAHFEMVRLLAGCERGDYFEVLSSSDNLIDSGAFSGDLYDELERVNKLAHNMTNPEGGLVGTEESAKRSIRKAAQNCIDLLKISESKEEEYSSSYEVDLLLSKNDYENATSKTVNDILEALPNNADALRYAINYYNINGEIGNAEECAAQLLKLDKSRDNIVLYADVMAQKMLEGSDEIDLITDEVQLEDYIRESLEEAEDNGDKEAAKLLKKAKKELSRLSKYTPDEQEYQDTFDNVLLYCEQANGLPAKRIINWVNAQKPLGTDESGVIDLQLARLYNAAGERDKSREIVTELVKNADKIPSTSPIKSGIETFSYAYLAANVNSNDVDAAVNALQQSNVFLKNTIVSRGFSEFIGNVLKYERVSVFISDIDAKDYPVVRAFLNVNGSTGGKSELASDFTEEDFAIADNGYDISDFKRLSVDENNSISIALVVDNSGSMDGSRISNARDAVASCIRNMNPDTQQLSIVAYDNTGWIVTPLTNDKQALNKGAQELAALGGTAISTGIMSGLESLKNAVGTKAMILMTDGADGSSYTMPEALEAAVREKVPIFTISMGAAESEYMNNIAVTTGGKFMEASNETELANIYTMLQGYIVNNYCFEYTVTEDTQSNPRYMEVSIPKYGVKSARTYAYGGVNIMDDGSYIIRSESAPVRLLSASPSLVSVKDLELGTAMFIEAPGVKEGSRLYINGTEISDANIVPGKAVAFVLKGKYLPGALEVKLVTPDGYTVISNKLASVSQGASNGTGEVKTITLGGKCTISADSVRAGDAYKIILEKGGVLNGFIKLDAGAVIESAAPVDIGKTNIFIENGTLFGESAYVDFSFADANGNYGQMALGGKRLKVLEKYSLDFSGMDVSLYSDYVAFPLTGLGTVYSSLTEFDGTKLTYTLYDGSRLSDMENNLRYALTGKTDVPKSNALNLIAGIQSNNYSENYYQGVPQITLDELTVIISNDFMSLTGSGSVYGNLGPFSLSDGTVTIDTTNGSGSLFEISGTVNSENISEYIPGINTSGLITITSNGLYPEELEIDCGSDFKVNGKELSKRFNNENADYSLDAAVKLNYDVDISDYIYANQLEPVMDVIPSSGDRVEFLSDENGESIKITDSKTAKSVTINSNSITIPINSDAEEVNLFSTALGGELSGGITLTYNKVFVSVEADGHLDNIFYGIKYDGRTAFTAEFSRNAGYNANVNVTLECGDKSFSYNAVPSGNIRLDNGFNEYWEDENN